MMNYSDPDETLNNKHEIAKSLIGWIRENAQWSHKLTLTFGHDRQGLKSNINPHELLRFGSFDDALTYKKARGKGFRFLNEARSDCKAEKFLLCVFDKLNKDLLGNNYKRIVGRSYFSYFPLLENQRPELTHFHVLVDRPINIRLLKKEWNYSIGWAEVEKLEDVDAYLNTMFKLLVRYEYVKPSFRDTSFLPKNLPSWWD